MIVSQKYRAWVFSSAFYNFFQQSDEGYYEFNYTTQLAFTIFWFLHCSLPAAAAALFGPVISFLWHFDSRKIAATERGFYIQSTYFYTHTLTKEIKAHKSLSLALSS